MRQAGGAAEAALCGALAAIQGTTAAWEPTMNQRKGPDPVCTRDAHFQREMPDHNRNPRGELQC
jgi:hypothetical protein